MISHQVKVLRKQLKAMKLTSCGMPKLRVTALRYYAGKTNGKAVYELGSAVCFTDALTDEQIAELKRWSQFVEIDNRPDKNIAIIKH